MMALIIGRMQLKGACAPLEKEKVIEKEYADLIINSIKNMDHI